MNEKNKNRLLILNIDKIGAALWINNSEQLLNTMSDARVMSKWAEIWASQIYDFPLSENSNEPGRDGTLISDKLLTDNIDISVKCLTKSGVKFQQSKYQGSGRECTKENLLESIGVNKIHITVDITDLPKIKFIPIHSSSINKLIEDDTITSTGLTKEKFYNTFFKRALIDDDFIIIPNK